MAVLVLAVIALASLAPWETSSVGPRLSVSPDIGVVLGEARAVANEPQQPGAKLAVADARRPALVAAPAADPPRRAGVAPAVSRAVPVAIEEPAPVAPSPAKPQPAPQPEPAPAPAPVPVALPVPPPAAAPPSKPPPLGGSPGLGSAGGEELGPIEVCAGDEYALALLLYIEAVLGEEAAAELLAMRFTSETGAGTVYLEGASIAVLELIELLLAENECLTIEIELAVEAEVPAPAEVLPPAPVAPDVSG